MSDVIDRLRAIYPEHHQVNQWCVRYEAATEIERLRAENEKLRAALKPFADRVDDFIPEKHDAHRAFVTLGEIRAAAAAIREAGE